MWISESSFILLLLDFFVEMNELVRLHVALGSETFPTDFTTVRFLSSMDSLVVCQIARGGEQLLTVAAVVAFLSCRLLNIRMYNWKYKQI